MIEEQQDHLEDSDLTINNDVAESLNETSKWAKFIGISFFIFSGLVLIVMGAEDITISRIFDRFTPLSSLGPDNFYLRLAIIIFAALAIAFLGFLLINFAAKTRIGLETENTEPLNRGLSSLKLYFIIASVISILSLLSDLKSMADIF